MEIKPLKLKISLPPMEAEYVSAKKPIAEPLPDMDTRRWIKNIDLFLGVEKVFNEFQMADGRTYYAVELEVGTFYSMN